MDSGSGQNVLLKIRRQALDKLANIRSRKDELFSLINNVVLPAEHAAEELLQATDKKSLLKILESRNQIIQHVTDRLEILSAKLTLDSDSSSEIDNDSQAGSSTRMSNHSVPDLVPSLPPSFADITNIPPPVIPTNPTLVDILDPGSPSEFYVKLSYTNPSTVSTYIERLLATKTNLSASVLKVGHFYAVRRASTEMWCRGQVRSLNGETADVFFVDYGTMEVIPSEAFAALPLAVSRIPSLAIECQLKDVAPLVSENWPLRALSRFSEILLTSSEVTAIFFDADAHGKHFVSLQVPGSSAVPEFVCLESLLVQEKLARPLSDTLKCPGPVLWCSIKSSPNLSESCPRANSLSPQFSANVPARPSRKCDFVSARLSGVDMCPTTPTCQVTKVSTNLEDIFDDWDEYQARNLYQSCDFNVNFIATNSRNDISPVISMKNIEKEEISYVGTKFLSVAPPTKFEMGNESFVVLQGAQPKVLENLKTFRPPRAPNSVCGPVKLENQENQATSRSLEPRKNNTSCDDTEDFISALSGTLEEEEKQDWSPSDAYNMKNDLSAYVWNAHLINMVLEFPKDSAMMVKLSYIESPTHFYIHPVTSVTGQLDDLHYVLQYLYQDSEVPLELVISPEDSVATGRFLAAKWADDGHWYRCTIVATENDNGQYFATVLFVDYGNSARVPFTDLRPLHKSLIGLPRLARLARLAEIFPLNTNFREEEEEFKTADWPNNATALFLNLTGYDETFSAIVLPKSRPVTWPLELVLVDKNENVINSQMVVMGVARSELFGKTVFDDQRPESKATDWDSELQLGAEFSNMTSTTPVNGAIAFVDEADDHGKEDKEGKIFGLTNEEALACWDPMMEDYKSARNNYHFDSKNVDSVLTGIIPKDDARLCRFFRATGKCFKGDKCVFEHIFTDNAPYTLDKVEVLPDPPLFDLPDTGSWVSVNVVLFHNAKSFSANLEIQGIEGFEETFETLDDAIQTEYGRTVIGTVSNPSTGETVIAKWGKDGRFYRAKIKEQSQEDEDMYNVLFADFGNEDVVHLRDMRQPHRRFMHLPFQAVHCWLHGIETDIDSPEAVQYLTSFVEGKCTRIRVLSKEYQDLYVELFTATYDGEEEALVCVNKLIVDKGLAREATTTMGLKYSRNQVSHGKAIKIPG